MSHCWYSSNIDYLPFLTPANSIAFVTASGGSVILYKKTLAVDFLEKRLWIEPAGEELTFFLWDTAGQEEYDAITRGYYKGAGAAIIAFSTVDRASFEAVESWYKKIVEE
ncbi:Ras- protein Rab-23, partial [Perkinsus olseni]